ncbi:uncharacterized protein TNCV_659051 [Trichonephila clavipes]|nr:uncharacterized protein TNCV_659051 [Trichonephila clavipes]
MVLKANDRRTSCPCHDEFRGPRSDYVRQVNAATTPGYQYLSEFARGFIVDAREMGHSISEVSMEFGFSHTTISRVYREYQESGNTSNLRRYCGRKKFMQVRDQRRLTRIIKRDRGATLLQISADFKAGPSTNVPVRTFSDTSSIWAFRAEGPLDTKL